MKIAPKPENEQGRLKALHEYDIMDSEMEDVFNEITKLAAQICNTPISLISLIDEDRQWLKARFGISITESSRDIAFCAHTILENEYLEVPDALEDDRFYDNPAVSGELQIRFYAGFPLTTPAGYNVGSLCVIDNKNRNLSASQVFALKCLAKQVVSQMELRIKNKELLRLNEQNKKLLSIISHDIKAPINELKSLMKLSDLARLTPDEFENFTLMIRKSLDGTNNLIDNLLEWSQVQFNSTDIQKKKVNLSGCINEVIGMHQVFFEAKRNSVINLVSNLVTINTNEKIFQFVLRNLLLNANKFTASGIISIQYLIAESGHRIQISDNGIGMSDTKLSNLFNPDKRISSKGTAGEKGSGLGLKLCQDFLERINGSMEIKSEINHGTLITITIPS